MSIFLDPITDTPFYTPLFFAFKKIDIKTY